VGRYKSARQTREESQKRSAYLKIFAVAMTFASLIAWYKVTEPPRLDDVTLCPATSDTISVLLVDVTDTLSLPQRQDFRNQLEGLRETIPRYGKLSVFKVDPLSDQLLKPVIERCNPGTAEDVSWWTGNKTKAAFVWDNKFKAPIDSAFDQIAGASNAPESPILESIQSVALTQLNNRAAEGKVKRLIIASDLLQNTTRISFYNSLPTQESIFASNAFRLLRTDLRGVEVELWMLQRADVRERQPIQLIQLWTAMIGAMGGKVVRVYNVSG
jgi:hypothetical protein